MMGFARTQPILRASSRSSGDNSCSIDDACRCCAFSRAGTRWQTSEHNIAAMDGAGVQHQRDGRAMAIRQGQLKFIRSMVEFFRLHVLIGDARLNPGNNSRYFTARASRHQFFESYKIIFLDDAPDALNDCITGKNCKANNIAFRSFTGHFPSFDGKTRENGNNRYKCAPSGRMTGVFQSELQDDSQSRSIMKQAIEQPDWISGNPRSVFCLRNGCLLLHNAGLAGIDFELQVADADENSGKNKFNVVGEFQVKKSFLSRSLPITLGWLGVFLGFWLWAAYRVHETQSPLLTIFAVILLLLAIPGFFCHSALE